LVAVDAAAGQNVFAAFMSGVRTAALALIALSLPVLFFLIATVRRRDRISVRVPAAPRR
jgi:hypothetical protein